MSVMLTRRSVVGLGLLATTGFSLPLRAASQPAAFIAQSGDPHQGLFYLGQLAVDDEPALRAMVAGLRQDSSYRRVLRARSTDKYKVAFARRLLDELAKRRDVRFTAIEFTVPVWPKAGKARDGLVLAAARDIAGATAPGTTLTILDNGDAENFGTLHRAASGAKPASGIRYGQIAQDDLLQVTAFLASLANTTRTNTRSAKSELTSHLKKTLAVGEISARGLANHPLYAVRAAKLAL